VSINILFHEERKDTGIVKSLFLKEGFRGIGKRYIWVEKIEGEAS
jgi:hypothetical protein